MSYEAFVETDLSASSPLAPLLRTPHCNLFRKAMLQPRTPTHPHHVEMVISPRAQPDMFCGNLVFSVLFRLWEHARKEGFSCAVTVKKRLPTYQIRYPTPSLAPGNYRITGTTFGRIGDCKMLRNLELRVEWMIS
jgi:hypothetical protein